jgi:formylglycine-generating enzyme required for sulfatase activity/energy-coupling factor transporter ATP-binding protein EcfA2
MQCPNCHRTWPEEFKGCPICMIPFGQVVAEGEQAQAAADHSLAADQVQAPVATGDESIAAGGHVIFTGDGSTVVIGEAPVKMTAVERESALGRYLQHVISRNRYLQLQGIRSRGRLVHIELDQIYVTLRATRQRVVAAEEDWLAHEAALAPGELHRLRERATTTETVTVSVNEALAAHRRLAVLGDPGSGKTTLLRFLALLYARDLAEGSTLVQDKLGLDESGCLPILLPLRQIGAYLRAHRPADDGTEGCGQLLDFLVQSLKNERLPLPADFFDEWLTGGRAVVLLDGLDEVADPDLRRRVSRLVEAFSRAYPDCRYAVTSRLVGYTGPARLGEEYVTTTVRDFSLADVQRFLANWHRLVAVGQMGPGDSAEAYAAEQTRQLLAAIEASERIRELAINPLMLTVIAMVHRDRVKLPDRRAELYAEAVDVLLGKWEEAKGLQEIPILEGQPFDTGDRRLMLQALALHLHEGQQKEIAAGDLRRWLGEQFQPRLGDWRAAGRAVDRFLRVIEERTGLLAARGEGVYAFSHLTFQEYLAALAVAARDDYVAYTLARAADPWWREVILLQAGYLSLQSKERTTRLIRAIADAQEEPVLYHNLLLAAECLRDVGENRVEGGLEAEMRQKLWREFERPLRQSAIIKKVWIALGRRPTQSDIIRRRAAAAEVLARIETGGPGTQPAFWQLPHGEPIWGEIPAGEFWMGSERQDTEEPARRVYLDRFWIARVPITNAQYQFFVDATDTSVPDHWESGRPPKNMESHPVVNVSWYDALTYCRWLSEATGKNITLPLEAAWEKAARGDKDKREFPWGDTFDATGCNNSELELGGTTPVGIFPKGASPYGVLEMAGNVWEWTRSICPKHRCTAGNEPEDPPRVVRGGSFALGLSYSYGDTMVIPVFYVGAVGNPVVGCNAWDGVPPGVRSSQIGFRVVVAPAH